MMMGQPGTWHALMDVLVDLTIAFLKVQLDAGWTPFQVFDSWAGTLSLADYRTFVLPHSTRVFAEIADRGVPMTHFGVGTTGIARCHGGGYGPRARVQWWCRLAYVAGRCRGSGRPWYGLAGAISIQSSCWPDGRWPRGRRGPSSTTDVGAGRGAAGHVFNLGHGSAPGHRSRAADRSGGVGALLVSGSYCVVGGGISGLLPPIDCAWRSVLARPSLCSTQAIASAGYFAPRLCAGSRSTSGRRHS